MDFWILFYAIANMINSFPIGVLFDIAVYISIKIKTNAAPIPKA